MIQMLLKTLIMNLTLILISLSQLKKRFLIDKRPIWKLRKCLDYLLIKNMMNWELQNPRITEKSLRNLSIAEEGQDDLEFLSDRRRHQRSSTKKCLILRISM